MRVKCAVPPVRRLSAPPLLFAPPIRTPTRTPIRTPTRTPIHTPIRTPIRPVEPPFLVLWGGSR